MNAKIIDLTKKFKPGKWIEVGYLCAADPNETLEIVAKFKDQKSAIFFAEWYNSNYGGFHTIIIR